jgi:hypothetical protein
MVSSSYLTVLLHYITITSVAVITRDMFQIIHNLQRTVSSPLFRFLAVTMLKLLSLVVSIQDMHIRFLLVLGQLQDYDSDNRMAVCVVT